MMIILLPLPLRCFKISVMITDVNIFVLNSSSLVGALLSPSSSGCYSTLALVSAVVSAASGPSAALGSAGLAGPDGEGSGGQANMPETCRRRALCHME